jgi:hypothetical protein
MRGVVYSAAFGRRVSNRTAEVLRKRCLPVSPVSDAVRWLFAPPAFLCKRPGKSGKNRLQSQLYLPIYLTTTCEAI